MIYESHMFLWRVIMINSHAVRPELNPFCVTPCRQWSTTCWSTTRIWSHARPSHHHLHLHHRLCPRMMAAGTASHTPPQLRPHSQHQPLPTQLIFRLLPSPLLVLLLVFQPRCPCQLTCSQVLKPLQAQLHRASNPLPQRSLLPARAWLPQPCPQCHRSLWQQR